MFPVRGGGKLGGTQTNGRRPAVVPRWLPRLSGQRMAVSQKEEEDRDVLWGGCVAQTYYCITSTHIPLERTESGGWI